MIHVYVRDGNWHEFSEAASFVVDSRADVVLFDRIGLKVGVVKSDYWTAVHVEDES